MTNRLCTAEVDALDGRIELALKNSDVDQAEQLLKQRAPLLAALRLEAARIDNLERTERVVAHSTLLIDAEHEAEEELDQLANPDPPCARLRMWSFTGQIMHFETGTDFHTNFLGSFIHMRNFRYCYYRVDADAGDIRGLLCFREKTTESTLYGYQPHLDYARTTSTSVRKLIGTIDEELKLGHRFVFGNMPRFTKKRN